MKKNEKQRKERNTYDWIIANIFQDIHNRIKIDKMKIPISHYEFTDLIVEYYEKYMDKEIVFKMKRYRQKKVISTLQYAKLIVSLKLYLFFTKLSNYFLRIHDNNDQFAMIKNEIQKEIHDNLITTRNSKILERWAELNHYIKREV